MTEAKPIRVRLLQGGVQVAAAEGVDRERVMREIEHYALVYGRDGLVRAQVRFGAGRWRELTL